MGRTKTLRIAALALVATLAAWLAVAPRAAAGPRHLGEPFRSVHVIDVEGMIEPALAAYVDRSLDAAEAANAACVVLRINSPGGRIDSMFRMLERVQAVRPRATVIAWVPGAALSAAAILALACDEVVMAPGAMLGDAQPVTLTFGGMEPAGEKVETVLRQLVRALAADRHWDPIVAEKLISKDKELLEVRGRSAPGRMFVDADEFTSARDDDLVQGVPRRQLERVRVAVPRNTVLTMSAEEAIYFGFVERTFPDEAALLAELADVDAPVTQVGMSWRERASRWLLGMSGLLGGLVVVCVGLSIFQGIGLATAVGAAALVLFGMVVATADLANGFALLLIGVGIALLAVEAFLLPGFGVAGILGIVATAAGFLTLATGATFGDAGGLTWGAFTAFLGQFAGSVVLGGVMLVLLSRVVPSLPFARRHMHLPADGLGAGAVVVPGDVAVAVGALGTAATDLRPSGRATLGDRQVDVTSEGGWVGAGAAVRVLRVEGARVFVRPTEEHPT